MRRSALLFLLVTVLPVLADTTTESCFVDSGGVKLHYQTTGKGPLCVLLHGFPDFHRTWHAQVPVLAKHFQVVAIDLRGYNRSDKPTRVEDYTIDKLVADVAAVIKHFKKDRAVIVGHDWGGAIAWSFAMARPEMTDRLVVLNCPHPANLRRELASNPDQQKASAYARAFQQKDAHLKLKPEALVFWLKDNELRKEYLEAMKRSSMEGMLAYYKANYPRAPYKADGPLPKVKCPVLLIHGLGDTALLPGALDGTWKLIDAELTTVTIPKAGHWVHYDAKEAVNRHLLRWLVGK
jgi:pimeloyl-ACP methyl ester carboxylesterase